MFSSQLINCVRISLPLLEEGLSIDKVLANGCRLPWEVGTRGITLEEVWLVLVPAADEQAHAKWTNTSGKELILWK